MGELIKDMIVNLVDNNAFIKSRNPCIKCESGQKEKWDAKEMFNHVLSTWIKCILGKKWK